MNKLPLHPIRPSKAFLTDYVRGHNTVPSLETRKSRGEYFRQAKAKRRKKEKTDRGEEKAQSSFSHEQRERNKKREGKRSRLRKRRSIDLHGEPFVSGPVSLSPSQPWPLFPHFVVASPPTPSPTSGYAIFLLLLRHSRTPMLFSLASVAPDMDAGCSCRARLPWNLPDRRGESVYRVP